MDSFSRYALALELLKMNKLEEARQEFEHLLKVAPDYLATYFQLGKIQESSGEKEKALATYSSGIEVARSKKDRHTLSELQSARQNLLISGDE